MKQHKFIVKRLHSVASKLGNIIITARYIYDSSCNMIIGSPGLPNIDAESMYPGDAKLFETPTSGVLEVRLLSLSADAASVLVTQISPRPGLMAGFVTEDQTNIPFTVTELEKISESIDEAKQRIHKLNDIPSEQTELILDKLDEMERASKRLGRKDWTHFTSGLLTNIAVAAAFTPARTKELFTIVSEAFAWFFSGMHSLT